MPRIRILCFVLMTLILAACGGDDDHSPPVEITPTVTATATATVQPTTRSLRKFVQ